MEREVGEREREVKEFELKLDKRKLIIPGIWNFRGKTKIADDSSIFNWFVIVSMDEHILSGRKSTENS